MSDYIRYQEAEWLFKSYPKLQIVIKSLQADLSSLKANANDAIYSQVLGNHSGGSLPPAGSISDKTGNLAVRYRLNCRMERAEIIRDINKLSTVIDKLTFAITSMRAVQRLVLETYYWSEQNTWKQVISVLNQNNYFMSRSKALKVRNDGINYIMAVSKITSEQYIFALNWLSNAK